MKTARILSLLICMVALCVASYAQDNTRRENSRAFKPTLDGTWQLCSLAAGENGQPQLSLLPILKVIDSNGKFQHIGIPAEGGCFIEKQGLIEKTSDSTFVENITKMKPDSVADKPLVAKFRFKGPMWLMIEYQEDNGTEVGNELWIRIRPKGHVDRRANANGKPQFNGQRGERRNHGGQNKQRRENNTNPFEENNNSFDDSDSDFD
ncbi:MAG: DUF4488 domain-containing protein [Bacteroidaceae bacterium]